MIFKAFLESHENLIISLLTDLLPLPEGFTIVCADVLNPEIYPNKFQGKANDKPGKLFILDLKIKFERTLSDGQKQTDLSNVEMQTTELSYLPERVVAYAGRLHSQQLDRGDDFSQLSSVYSILFITKNLQVFKGIKDYYHVCRIKREGSSDVVFSEGLNFIVVELGKFDKKLEEIDNIRDAWCYLLKHSKQLDAQSYQKLREKGGVMDRAVNRLW